MYRYAHLLPLHQSLTNETARVLIVGAGGHGQCVADNLLTMQEYHAAQVPLGFVDDDSALTGEMFFGLRVLGDLSGIHSIEHDAIIVGIGKNSVRRRIYEKLAASGERFASAIHPAAQIMRGVEIGYGTYIGALATISVASRIGVNTILNGTSVVGHHVDIGDHVHIAPGVTIAGDVHIGTGTMIGIGANIIPGITVGANCIIGAGTLVRADVPDGATVVGVPARHVTKKQE